MLTWNRIQEVYEPAAERHARAAQLLGLKCPEPVFRGLFHAAHANADLGRLLRGVDIGRVTWGFEERSGVALRQVFVDRAFEVAVDEAYAGVTDQDFVHERTDVVASWRERGTWIEPPILLAGEVLGMPVSDVLLVGSTRLGCLRAFLDQGVVAESARHEVWVGRAAD